MEKILTADTLLVVNFGIFCKNAFIFLAHFFRERTTFHALVISKPQQKVLNAGMVYGLESVTYGVILFFKWLVVTL